MRGLRHQLLWGLLVASLLLAVMQLWAVYRVKRENALIADWVVLTEQNVAQHSSDATAAEPVYGRSPEVRMARASYLRQKQRYNEALEILSLIVGHGDSRLRTQSRYNLGNLYLSQAMAEIEAGQLNQAAPLLMLAIWRSSLSYCGRETAPQAFLQTRFDLLAQGLCTQKGKE